MTSTFNRWLDEDESGGGDGAVPPGVSSSDMGAAIATALSVQHIRYHPPLPLTGDTTTNEYGTFTISASSIDNTYVIKDLFDHQIDTSWRSAWVSSPNSYNSDGTYNGSARLHPYAPLGEYVIFKMPYKIAVGSFSMMPRRAGNVEASLDSMPRNFRVYARVDDASSWTLVSHHTDAVFTERDTFAPFDATEGVFQAHDTFAIVVEVVSANTNVSIGEFRLHQHTPSEILDIALRSSIASLRSDITLLQTEVALLKSS
jgi:hypothetical protein